jgi:hypothetical protein
VWLFELPDVDDSAMRKAEPDNLPLIFRYAYTVDDADAGIISPS